MHDYLFEWFNDSKADITAEELYDIHQEYFDLKRSFVKLQVLSSSHGNTGNNVSSVKNINNFNSNLLCLPAFMVNRRNLCLIRCKFSKKNKLGLFNTSVAWKVAASNSDQE